MKAWRSGLHCLVGGLNSLVTELEHDRVLIARPLLDLASWLGHGEID